MTWPLLAVLIWMAVGYGCAAAAVPIAGDIAGEAAKQSMKVVWLGKTVACERVGMRRAVDAVHTMADELDLNCVKEARNGEQLTAVYEDETKQKIEVKLLRHTDAVTEIRVDVGWFGTYEMGDLAIRLVLEDVAREKGSKKMSPVRRADGGYPDFTDE